MTYPGGKNGAGVRQRIINQMPPHEAYIEAFLGSGAVLRAKRPAERNIGIDPSRKALSLCLDLAGSKARDFNLLEGDALTQLPSLKTMVADSIFIEQPDTLIYADPPYVMSTRSGRELYEHEMDDAAHEQLLDLLTGARCMVMISGYRSPLYDARLQGWRRIDYLACTRRGMVPESLWMNYAEPTALHDYSHLGDGYRARERIKRKAARWKARYDGMNRLEQLAIMDALTGPGAGADDQP